MKEEKIVHSLDEGVEVSVPKKRLALKIVLIVLLVIVGVAALLAILLVPPVLALQKSVKKLELSGKAVAVVAKSQDLPSIKTQLEIVGKDLGAVETDYKRLSVLKYLPIANNY